jgi:hypothetical protein
VTTIKQEIATLTEERRTRLLKLASDMMINPELYNKALRQSGLSKEKFDHALTGVTLELLGV